MKRIALMALFLVLGWALVPGGSAVNPTVVQAQSTCSYPQVWNSRTGRCTQRTLIAEQADPPAEE